MVKDQLEDQINEERRAYFRAWRAANPDKTRKHRQNYWRKRTERKLKEQNEGG
jgi:uncharacterized short protein YbdD (DUF466 family)